MPHISFPLLAPLTWSLQLDLLRYGSAELVESVAPVFALKGNQVLVQKHKSSVFVFVTLRSHIWWLEILSIFRPPVPNKRGRGSVFVTNHFHSVLWCRCCWFLLWWWVSLRLALNSYTLVIRKGDDWTWGVTHYCWRLLNCNVK